MTTAAGRLRLTGVSERFTPDAAVDLARALLAVAAHLTTAGPPSSEASETSEAQESR